MTTDTARLDKLPQCFHMLRTDGKQWWLTYDTNRQHGTVREAIDAYKEPQ
jgi:hypothetical protein